MRMWHCAVGDQKYGPVSEDELKSWVSQGRLGRNDLVWTEGMVQWVQAGAVPELFGGIPALLSSLSGVNPPGGTGGRTPNKGLMAQARAILKGNWGLPIGFIVLFILLLCGISVLSLALCFLAPIALIVVMGAFQVSLVTFFLALTRRGNPEIGMLFSGFKRFGTALGALLLTTLLIIAWELLFIIPGIIAAFRYAMTFYLIADNPNLGPLEAIRESKRMMYGHKWRLFCLGLRFIGWYLLCLLTCGIGFLWFIPYVHTSLARFYDDLRQPAQAIPGAIPVARPVEPTPPPAI